MSSDTMIALKPSECTSAIELLMRTTRSLFLWGSPGLGKSQLAQAVATAYRRAFIDFRLSQMEPTDLRGIPYPSNHGGLEGVVWSAPHALPRDLDLSFVVTCEAEVTKTAFWNPKGSNNIHYVTAPSVRVRSLTKGLEARLVTRVTNPNAEFFVTDDKGAKISDDLSHVYVGLYDSKGELSEGKFRIEVTGKCFAILGLEEFNSAPVSVQAASYQFVLDRRLGDYIVPDGVFIMGMGNKDTDKGLTYKMAPPIKNRLIHYEIKADFPDWQVWALQNQIHRDIVGFLSAFQNKLCTLDVTTDERGFNTPRSWQMLSDILKTNEANGVSETVMLATIIGTVGTACGTEFNAHRKLAMELPKASDILNGTVKEMSKKPDSSLSYALATSLCYELKARVEEGKNSCTGEYRKSKEYAAWIKDSQNFFKFCMTNFQPDITVMAGRTALKYYSLPFKSDDPMWKEFTSKFARYLLD